MKTATISRLLPEPDEAFKPVQSIDAETDAELVELVRLEPPNEAALDVLVGRYWKPLYARCKVLTSDHDKAMDLAQSAWYRLLRNRNRLKPDGNFLAYITMIATNLFRDSYRTAKRAGPMAVNRLESLDAPQVFDDEGFSSLMDTVTDPNSLSLDELALMTIDIDKALERLTPQMRDVLVSRFIDGESCAEIGARYGRTEQSVSGWIRGALREMKTFLEEQPDDVNDFQATAAAPERKNRQ